MTRKGRKFIQGEEQQQVFDEIKRRLVKLPILHLPDNKGRFHLTQMLVNLLEEVLYIRFKMAGQI